MENNTQTNTMQVAGTTEVGVMKLETFINEKLGIKVRILEINGVPYIVGDDAVNGLEYERSTSNVLRSHLKNKDVIYIDKQGIRQGFDNKNDLNQNGLTQIDFDYRLIGRQGGYLITEPAFYKLVGSSKMEKAEEMQDWIYYEVLPQIRLTGGYIPVSEQDTEETIQQRAQEIANETIKYKDKEIARLKESYEQEHEARLRLIKTYNESKKEIRGLQNELDEAYVKMDLVPLMMEIQNKCEPPRELDLKSIIIKMNDTSKGYQRYKQWVEDNCMTDGAVDKECGHFLKHSKLHCFTKQYIFDLESVDALYYLALMFEEVMLNY